MGLLETVGGTGGGGDAWSNVDRTAQWLAADALEPSSYAGALDGARAAVLTIGTPPLPALSEDTSKWQVRMNGTVTATAVG